MAKYLIFHNAGNDSIAYPVERLVSVEQTDATSIIMKFENKDNTAGAVTTIDLTVAAGKEFDAMKVLLKQVASDKEYAVIWDRSSRTSSHFTDISIDTSGVNTTGLTPGAAISGSANTIYHSWIERNGNIIKTSIYIDLTDLEGTGTTDQIIGIGADASHLGQVTTAKCGTIYDVVVTCIETPDADLQELDLVASADAVGKKGDDPGSGGDFTDEAAIIVDADYSAAGIFSSSAVPAANDYLYLASVTATADTATSGKLLIELFGTE